MAALTSLKKWVEKVTAYLTHPPVIGVPFSVELTDKASGGKTCTTTINLPTGYEVVKNCKPLSIYISGYSTTQITDRDDVTANGNTISFWYYLYNPSGYTGNLYLCGTILCYRTDVSGTLPPSEIHREIDYVVDQGVDGIWTYRKWNSGIAECWGKISLGSKAVTTQYGNGYYATADTTQFPSGLFTNTPCVSASLKDGGGYGTWYNLSAITKDNMAGYVYSVASVTTSMEIQAHAIGRWK